MNKSSKIIFIILLVVVLWSVIATYNRTMIKKDFYTEQSEKSVDETEESPVQSE